MADLLVHYAIGYSGGKLLKDRRTRVMFYIGNFLPDLVFKTFLFISNSPTWYCEPSHSPLILIVICFLIAHLFEEEIRKGIFWSLLAGSYLHILIDSFKSYMGQGVILWAFPFSMDRFEFGLYNPDETIYLMLPAIILIVIVELSARLFSKTA